MERFTASMATNASDNSGRFARTMQYVYKLIMNAAESAKKKVDIERGTMSMNDDMIPDIITMLHADGYTCNTTNTHLEIKWP